MSFRELQKQYSAALIGVASGLLLCSIGFIVWWMTSSSSSSEDEYDRPVYFFDLNSKELMEVASGTQPPIETDSGDYQGMPAGVRAYVYCCGPKMRDTKTFIGYLEVPVSALPENLRPSGMPETGPEGEPLSAIRGPEDETWLDPNSPAGMAFMADLSGRCSVEKKLTIINPPPRKK